MEETPSRGQHWVYYIHNKPKTDSSFHNTAAVEVLGPGKLAIMSPSLHYKRLNDNAPTVIQDLEDLFYDALWKAGVKTKEKAKRPAWFDRQDLVGDIYRGKIHHV
jgi:hypothetical protein